jgi:hypothetical protein
MLPRVRSTFPPAELPPPPPPRLPSPPSSSAPFAQLLGEGWTGGSSASAGLPPPPPHSLSQRTDRWAPGEQGVFHPLIRAVWVR